MPLNTLQRFCLMDTCRYLKRLKRRWDWRLTVVVLEREAQREKAIEAFGAWSERSDVRDGVEYVEKMRVGWSERTARIDNV